VKQILSDDLGMKSFSKDGPMAVDWQKNSSMLKCILIFLVNWQLFVKKLSLEMKYDFVCFLKIKSVLKGQIFQDTEDIQKKKKVAATL
jgi:hypothetical protein